MATIGASVLYRPTAEVAARTGVSILPVIVLESGNGDAISLLVMLEGEAAYRVDGVRLDTNGAGANTWRPSNELSKLEQIRRNIRQAQPLVAMASPPTITLSAASASATTNGAYNCRYDNADLSVFTYAGSVPLPLDTSGAFSNVSMTGGASFYGTGNGSHGPLDVYFGCDAPDVEIAFKLPNSFDITYRISVDIGDGNGYRPTAVAPRTDLPTDFSTRRIKLAFGSAAPRKFRLECDEWIAFSGVDCATVYSCWKTPVDSPRIVVVGDSYTAGTGASSRLLGLSRQLRDLLGTPDVIGAGAASTGYLAVAGAGTMTFRQRIATEIAPLNPDLIINLYGYNDNGQTDAALQKEASLAYAAVFAALPRTRMITAMMRSSNSLPAASKFAAIKAAVQADPNFGTRHFYVDAVAAPVWTFGTGKSGATTGNGNADIYVNTDGIHPTDAGHSYLARRIAEAVTAILPGMT